MQHFHKNIQGWSSFIPWYKEQVQAASPDRPSIFVELGTWKGKSAAFMAVEIANSRKPITFYTVDTFQGSDEPAHHKDPVIQQGRLEEVAKANLRPVLGRYVRIVKSDSAEFAGTFEDESVDFVFVDAGHTFELVSADIAAWWPKIRPGGVLAGDDFTWKGVQSAVTAYFGQLGEFTPQIRGGIHSAFGAKGFKCWRVVKKNPEIEPDWTRKCEICGQTPILPVTGMCGPCTFGEADTAGGNW